MQVISPLMPWRQEPFLVIILDTPDTPGYIGEIVADMRQAITNHQSDLNMVMMVPQISFYSH